jgi:hypothetical protein
MREFHFEKKCKTLRILEYSVSHQQREVKKTGAKFIVSDWGNNVDPGIGLSYCPPGYI